MCPEAALPRSWDASLAALRAAAEAGGAEAEAEVLLRISRGVTVRRARGAPSEEAAWREESVAVRVLLPEGGEGVAAAASWAEAEEAARRAVALAQPAEREAGGRGAPGGDEGAAARGLVAQRGLVAPRGTCASFHDRVAADPQERDELVAAIGEIERAALAVDERVVALDSALARSAVVDSYLVSTAGLALHQRHATAAAHAAIIARDGMSVAVRGDAWAGARLTTEEAARMGLRLGRAGLVHLVGSGAAPPQPPAILLSASALTEMTLPLAPALLGLSSEGPAGGEGFPRELTLAEDACDDALSRALPVDGEGRPLRRVAVIEDGTWAPPGARGLPRVRPGSGDAARPGWLRLSWSWRGDGGGGGGDRGGGGSGGGGDEAALLQALGTGLWIESAHAIVTEPATLSWRGAVAGFWVEDGRRRHPVAGIPFAARLPDLLRGAVAGGAEPEIAHASGALRAVPLVIRMPPRAG